MQATTHRVRRLLKTPRRPRRSTGKLATSDQPDTKIAARAAQRAVGGFRRADEDPCTPLPPTCWSAGADLDGRIVDPLVGEALDDPCSGNH